ncbi:MAG: MFS transporter [Bacteroidetes bacterium]|nr:MFS transporter [Bacteroidota bacterium]
MEAERTGKPGPALTIIVIAISIFMTNLDTSIVNIAMPAFTRIFHADTGEVSRVVLMYLLATVSLLLVFGKLSDLKGPEKIFTLGYLVFTVSSGLCAFAPSIALLVLFRFLQGIGSAMLLATWGAIAVKYLPMEIRGRAYGLVTVFGGVGMAIGAPVGGFLIKYLSWKWIFLINIPVGIAALILIRLILNRKNDRREQQERFDFPGAVLSFFGILVLFTLLHTGQDFGWLTWKTALLFLTAAGCLTGLYYRERKAVSPLLNIRILKNKKVLAGFATTVIVTMILMGFNFLFPFFFSFVRHLEPEKTGLLLMTFPIVTILVSPVSGYLCDKGSPRTVSLAALFFILVSGMLFATFGIQTSYYFVISAFLLFGIGLALFFTANTALLMSHATPAVSGMFTALISAVSYLGSALGINFFELIFSFRFPQTGTATAIASLPADLLTQGFFYASVFGIILAVTGIIAVLISKEKNKPLTPSRTNGL